MTTCRYLHERTDGYYFRRRIPGSSRKNRPIMLRLPMRDEKFAHTSIEILSREFITLFESFVCLQPPLPENLVHAYIHATLSESLETIRRQHRMARMSGRARPEDGMRRDALLIAIENLVEDGLQKTFPPSAIDPDWSPAFLEAVVHQHATERDAILSPQRTEQLCETFRKLSGFAPHGLEHIGQIREAFLMARATALRSLTSQHEAQKEAFSTLATQIMDTTGPAPAAPAQVEPLSQQVTPPTHRTNPVSRPVVPECRYVLTPSVSLIDSDMTMDAIAEQFTRARDADEVTDRDPETEPFGIDIAGACERSIKAHTAIGRLDQKTADSRRSRLGVFMLLTGVQTIPEIRQHHLRIFVEQMKRLPRSFLKSSKDGRLTLAEVQARANGLPNDDLGRAPSKINSYLDTLNSVLTYARSNEGTEVDMRIDTSILRLPETKRARGKRAAFNVEERRRLFEHPIWQGCKSAARRHDTGPDVVKDGLFWVPLIVAYTGGRMEEVAGLPVGAIIADEGGWGIDIRPHEERRLKNLQSTRLIPVHKHLLELGLMEHQARMAARGETYLFPELTPTSSKRKFYSQIAYNWAKARKRQLDGNPGKLDAHSLRHLFNQQLKELPGVSKLTRLDLLGHAGEDLNEEVYGASEGMPMAEKRSAIDLLPRIW